MKTVYFGEEGNSGIDVTYTRSSGKLYLSGWYDDMVGIEGEELSLLDFLKRIGVRKSDVVKLAKVWED